MKQQAERILARLRSGGSDVIGVLTPTDLPASLAGVRHVVVGAKWTAEGWQVARSAEVAGLPAGRVTRVRVRVGAERVELSVVALPGQRRVPWRPVGVGAALVALVLALQPAGVRAAAPTTGVTFDDVVNMFAARVREGALRGCVTAAPGKRPASVGLFQSPWAACGEIAGLIAAQQMPFVRTALASGYLPKFWEKGDLREPEGCVRLLPFGQGKAAEVCLVAQDPLPGVQ